MCNVLLVLILRSYMSKRAPISVVCGCQGFGANWHHRLQGFTVHACMYCHVRP